MWLLIIRLNKTSIKSHYNRPCDLVVTVPGYRSRGPEFDSRRYQERDLLSLVSTTEELLEWKSSGSEFRKPR
jgi:hypothetical protein